MFLVHRKYNNRTTASIMYRDMVLWLSENQGMGDRLYETFDRSFQDMVVSHLDLPDNLWHLTTHGYQEKNWWVCYMSYYDPALEEAIRGITACVTDEYVATQMILSL